MRIFPLVAVLAVLAGPSSAAPAKIPDVDGGALGVDPYVKEFQTAMEQANSELAGIQAAIQAVVVPPASRTGAMAAAAKAAADYAGVGAVVARAEAAHAKFLAHILGYKPADLDDRLNLKTPAFDSKADAQVRPKADRILKTSFASAGGAAPQQKLTMVSSKYSYNSSVGPVGSGFQTGLAPTAPQVADMGSIGQTMGGGGAGIGGSGMGSGPTDGTGVGSAAPAAAPSAGPAPASLSSNSSNVAQEAFKRAQERQQAAQAELDRRQQEQSQQQQQAAQMAQQMLSQAGQALGKTQNSAGGCASCNQQKQDQAATTEATAPPAS